MSETTGPELYRKALGLLAEAHEIPDGDDGANPAADRRIAEAQVLMTGAVAAAVALTANRSDFDLARQDLEAWRVTLRADEDR